MRTKQKLKRFSRGANRVLSESLTEEILAQMYYEKWNGVLPYLYGADGALIQVPIS